MAHVTYGFDLDLLGEVGPPPLPSLASYWRALPWSLHDFPNAAAFFLDSCVGPCSLGFSPIMKLRSRWVCLRYRSSRYARYTSKLLSFLRFK